mgnify:CR=1 FL=1
MLIDVHFCGYCVDRPGLIRTVIMAQEFAEKLVIIVFVATASIDGSHFVIGWVGEYEYVTAQQEA